ncbi:hypothetical protein C2E23DRAFT_784308 [Lenzites betulinus]|nr:hypothetical protein C2E23DRAFT_784308 [Lenzites betulinus]
MAGYRRLGSTLRADYARREIKLRGGLRKLIADAAVSVSGRADAKMWWTFEQYYTKTYLGAGIKLIGWPGCFVWQNLSGITGYERIAFLYQRWKKGKMGFAPVTAAERAAALADPTQAAPAARCIHTPPKLGRSDLKAHKRRPKTNPEGRPHRYTRNGPKSQKYVSQAAEARASAPMEDPMEEDTIESWADNDPVWGYQSRRARRLAKGIVRGELEEDPIENDE